MAPRSIVGGRGIDAGGLLMFGKDQAIRDPNGAPNYFVDYREKLDPELRWTDRIYPDGTWEALIGIRNLLDQLAHPLAPQGRNAVADGVGHVDSALQWRSSSGGGAAPRRSRCHNDRTGGRTSC